MTMARDNVTSIQEAAASMSEIDGGLRRGYADMTALCRGNVGAAMASSQAMMCGMQEITATLLAFLQSRAKDTLAASQQLAGCDSPAAVIEVQLDYVKAMLQAYSDEFDRLHALGGRILADVLVPVRSRPVLAPAVRAPAGTDTTLAA
jgi:hypothetical protein